MNILQTFDKMVAADSRTLVQKMYTILHINADDSWQPESTASYWQGINGFTTW